MLPAPPEATSRSLPAAKESDIELMRGLWGTSTTEPSADAVPAAEPAPTAAPTAGAEESYLSLAAQLEVGIAC